jgi:hypothetical protein
MGDILIVNIWQEVFKVYFCIQHLIKNIQTDVFVNYSTEDRQT